MPDLTTIFHHLQCQLFPALAAELGPLSAPDQQFCEVISLTNLGRFTRRYDWCGNGAPPAPPKRLELQPTRTLDENLADLPSRCDVGCKRNSKGHQESWIGYKLHLDTVDGDFPVSAVLTSASVHDSLVAIPLAQLTAQRVTSLYDLMDSAYDAPQIHAFSRSLGHVPIIDPHPRGGDKLPLAPAKALRFKERSAAERVNSLLKERYGGPWVRVRGAVKMMCHLLFGLLALTATALFARLC